MALFKKPPGGMKSDKTGGAGKDTIHLSGSNTKILQSRVQDFLSLIHIAKIEEKRRRQESFHLSEIQVPELVPLRKEHQGMGAFNGVIFVTGEAD
jgi:hypothetical protein